MRKIPLRHLVFFLLILALLYFAGYQAYDRRGDLKRLVLNLASPDSVSQNMPSVAESPVPTPLLRPTPTALPTPDYDVDEWVNKTLASMTLSQKIGQLVVTGVEGETITEEICKFIQQYSPAGVFYRPENVVNPARLKSFSADLQKCSLSSQQIPLFISIDHEGQYANRFDEGTSLFPNALALGATGNPSLAYQISLASGQELSYSGINMVFGPVADVLLNLDNKVIAQRVYSGDPQQASRFVEQVVTGYRQSGLIPVLKHFPGHGGVAGDTHRMLPVDDSDLKRLETLYFPPFRSGLAAGSPAVMLSHVAFPSISGAKDPSSLSEEMINLLRNDLSFDGLTITDALDMKAVKGGKTTIGEISREAINAGVDLLLLVTPEDARQSYDYLLDAAEKGNIPAERIDDAVRHILGVKASQGLETLSAPNISEPDWDSDARLASYASRQAVTLYQDEKKTIPFSSKIKRILVIGPNESWGFRLSGMDAAFKARGYAPEYVFYSQPREEPPQEIAYLHDLPRRAGQYDLVLMFTWNAHLNKVVYGDTWQVQMVQSLAKSRTPLVVVGLASPTDLLEFPDISTYLATFGTTQGALDGLLDILAGRQMPQGKNPLPGLP